MESDLCMFIIVLSKDLKEKLLSQGFKMLSEDKDKSTFIFDKNIKFNFNNVDKKDFLFSNKLTF